LVDPCLALLAFSGKRTILTALLQESKNERASRVRDNKRRHRVRHKEYVEDLERRVALAQEHGIQATREMQLAAQRVASENAKLRDLLRQAGYCDKTVEAWLSEKGRSGNGGHCQPQAKPGRGEASRKLASVRKSQTTKVEDKNAIIDRAEPLQKTAASAQCSNMPEYSPGHVESSTVNEKKTSPKKACTNTCKEDSPSSQNRDSVTAPCRILALLAENPAADVTQVPPPLPSEKQSDECEPDGSDGVDCSTAYKTLLQYATTPDKMDRIAVALEQGCTPSGAGGCKVKRSVMWKVLDEEC
jgi:hypothetical protein